METRSQEDALRPLAQGEKARLWREPRYDNLECLTASFQTHIYERHTHETYAIGSIIAGCECFEAAGIRYSAHPGDICFVNPETVHDGWPGADGYQYRTIYPSLELIDDLVQDFTGKAPKGTLTFPDTVARDPQLSRAFIMAHQTMEQQGAALEMDEAMLRVVWRIFTRYAKLTPAGKLRRENRAIERVRDYLAANLTENADLATLAVIAGLSRSHLIRAFKAETGLTPHAFLIDRRVRLARTLLLTGAAPVKVATESGFADQAHMTRAFKARIGVTPGAYVRMT